MWCDPRTLLVSSSSREGRMQHRGARPDLVSLFRALRNVIDKSLAQRDRQIVVYAAAGRSVVVIPR